MNYPIGDMLIRIKNAQQANHYDTTCDYSTYKEDILKVLVSEGYIEGYEVEAEENSVKKKLKVKLRYYQGQPAIQELVLVSTPGRKIYQKMKDLKQFRNGLGTVILSTSKGVMSDHEARKQENHVGGHVICRIY